MDTSIIVWLQSNSNPFLDTFFRIFTRFGDYAEIWFVMAIIMAFNKENRKKAFLGILAIALSHIVISIILKPLIMRPRPFEALGFDILIASPHGSSFPSGHASSSFAFAMLVFFMNWKYKWVAVSCAILMAFSRVYLGVHYVSDVLVGALVGTLIANILYRYQDVIINNFIKLKKRFSN